MRPVIFSVLFTTAVLTGCASSPQTVNEPANIPAQADLPPISFFASYLSDSMQYACNQARIEHGEQACVEDPLDPKLYFQALQSSGRFSKVVLSEDGFDYEVLLASKSTSRNNFSALAKNLLSKVTLGAVAPSRPDFEAEVSVTWRGIELGNMHYAGPLRTETEEQQRALAARLMNQAISQFADANLFSAEFLYAKLQASDYHRELTLPQHIADFQMLDMQLFRDPFQGAMVRYWHPLYADENIDVFVYPVAQQDLTDREGLLRNELLREKKDITLLAEARNLAQLNIGEVKTLRWQQGKKQFSGLYQGVDADLDSETLYASTYIFMMEDKFVKVSANFPPHIATHLVKQVVPQITVPGESKLMAQLRAGDS